MIQSYHLGESDFRGTAYANHPKDLKGCNDVLNITKPEVIAKIHDHYLEANADIIETNTFNANAISLADYEIESSVRDINLAAARLARSRANAYSTPERPRLIAGSVGPTPKSLGVLHGQPGAPTFDEVARAYREQIAALCEGGVDIVLIETVFDTLNCKAALYAARSLFDEQPALERPIWVSMTLEKGRSAR